jgi:hypothetical protein
MSLDDEQRQESRGLARPEPKATAPPHLPHTVTQHQTMSMMGITFNIHALCFFAAHGLSGAASSRVGNDLGAGRPRLAWITVQVRCCLLSVLLLLVQGRVVERGRCCCGVLLLWRSVETSVCHECLIVDSPRVPRRAGVGNDLGAGRPRLA